MDMERTADRLNVVYTLLMSAKSLVEYAQSLNDDPRLIKLSGMLLDASFLAAEVEVEIEEQIADEEAE